MFFARSPERAVTPAAGTVYFLTGLIALEYALAAAWSGVQVSPDTAIYSRWGDALIGNGFNFTAFLNQQSFVVPPVFYLGWIIVVATAKTVFGDAWMSAVVLLNCIALAAGAYLSLQGVRRLTGSFASLALAGGMFLVAADLMIFAPFVLSDLLFWGLTTCVLILGVELAADREGRVGRFHAIRTVATGSLITALALAFRPTALPLIAFWIAVLALHVAGGATGRRLQMMLATAAFLALVAIAAHAAVLMNPSLWPFGPLPGILDMLASEYRDGILVYAPGSSLVVAPASDLSSAMRLTIEKLAYFLTPWLPDYGRLHTALNLLFFVPAYALSAAALVNLRRLTPWQQRAATLLVFFAMALTVFHAMMQIDYDHRYRLPMLPALIMLAAIGLESVRRPQTLASTGRAR
jgi:hypothetical protein